MLKKFAWHPIDQDFRGGRFKQITNSSYPSGWETTMLHNRYYESPINRVKGFGKVNFHHNCCPFRGIHMMKDFSCGDEILRNVPSAYECHLILIPTLVVHRSIDWQGIWREVLRLG